MTTVGHRLPACTAMLLVLVGCASPARALAATDFTWSGATPTGAGAANWSQASNWNAGTSPSGAVGTVSFPALPSCPGADTCYTSTNDVSGIAADALSVSGDAPYVIGGDGITLGAGGLSVSHGSALPALDLPITLGADQPWSVTGADVAVSRGVTGSGHRLDVALGGFAFLSLVGDSEVGAVDVTGSDASRTGFEADFNGTVAVSGSLDASDGHPVTLERTGLIGSGSVGPLTSVGGSIDASPDLTVDGSVTLDARTAVGFFVYGPGTTAGTDYSQLSATGDVALGGASLQIRLAGQNCPALTPGATDTIITTTGTLSGTFAGLRDGATVVDPGTGQCDKQATFRIHYTAHSVTATVVTGSSGDFTWTGAAPLDEGGAWSTASNWVAGTPSGSVGTLTFPALPHCPTGSACRLSQDDIAGIAAHAVAIDDGAGYSISGSRALTIGAGGLSVSTSVASPSFSVVELPVALAAPQTWTIQGAGVMGSGLDIGGAVTGPGQDLGIALSNAGYLGLGDSEVGAVTITGADGAKTGQAAARNGWLQVGRLNATDGNRITLVDARLDAMTGIGPLTSTGGELGVSRGEGPGGTLTVAGPASFDAASALAFSLPGSELDATGDVALGDARLEVQPAVCDRSSRVGDTETLVHAAGRVTGTFAGLADGATLEDPDLCGSDATLRIGYTPHAVTATIVSLAGVSAPENGGRPVISGAAQAGSTLTEAHGTWSGSPTAFAYQWQDCDASGGGCTAIAGATAQAYELTAADVGHTIRVLESATNDGGTGGPVASAQTAVVQAAAQPSASPTPAPTPTVTPGPPPSNAFTVGARPVQAHGSVVLSVRVPGPGLIVAQPVTRKKLVQPTRVHATGPGTMKLVLAPTAAARRQLVRHGLTVQVRITFSPTGGTPKSRIVTVRFMRRRHR